MILTENINILHQRYSAMIELMHKKEQELKNEPIEIVAAMNSVPTMSIEVQGKRSYIHSQYDPINEAERMMNQYQNVEEFQHVFFYGVGLGYHIDAFLKKYPDMSFTLCEPNPAIMYHYLCQSSLQNLPVQGLRNVYIEWNHEALDTILGHFLRGVSEKVMLFIHPSYERIFTEKTKRFKERFIASVNNERAHIHIGLRFERLWTLNSAQNFSTILRTQSLFREKKPFFENKPAIIVAAGPSLEEEYDHIRKVKEEGLAYVFSVGSANKALLKEGIYPDAVFAYDPETGYMGLDVFGEIINEKIDTIPLIFGSSVGHVTVANYPGPLLHMVTTQDSVSAYYMKDEGLALNKEFVSDAPSIALVTFEALAKLGCNPIILVGQNFAFKNDKYYASGIQYNVENDLSAGKSNNIRPTHLTEMEKLTLIPVTSVDGGTVQTSVAHNRSREGMQYYISNNPNIEVINTTKGGAFIQGTKFVPFETLLEERLTASVVVPDWYKGNGTKYDLRAIHSQAEVMEKEYHLAKIILENIVVTFRKMDKLLKRADKKIERTFPEFDKYIEKLYTNQYFLVFIRPMVRIQQESLIKFIPTLRDMHDPFAKAQKLMEIFGKFIVDCHAHMTLIEGDFQKLQQFLLQECAAVNNVS